MNSLQSPIDKNSEIQLNSAAVSVWSLPNKWPISPFALSLSISSLGPGAPPRCWPKIPCFLAKQGTTIGSLFRVTQAEQQRRRKTRLELEGSMPNIVVGVKDLGGRGRARTGLWGIGDRWRQQMRGLQGKIVAGKEMTDLTQIFYSQKLGAETKKKAEECDIRWLGH